MHLIYEVTIFFSLALMAIVIAIFVLASSLHGNAVRKAAEEEEALFARRRERLEAWKGRMVDGVSGQPVDTTRVSSESIGRLAKDIDRIDKAISRARSTGKILTVHNIVTVPFCLLLVVIISSGIAIVAEGVAPNTLWGVSLLLLGFSLYWIYRNLRFIEGFSTLTEPSTDTTFDKDSRPLLLSKPIEISEPFQGSSSQHMRAIIGANLDSLPPREARILEHWYGMSSDRLSVKRIANKLGLSENQVIDLWHRGKRMNRHPSRSRPLRRFVESLPVVDERDPWQEFVGDLFGI